MRKRRLAVALAGLLALAGCGTSTAAASTTPTSASGTAINPGVYGAPTGSGCAGIATDNSAGSFNSMKMLTLAKAIAANPLTTKFASMLAADATLVTQLNQATGLTAFVPTDAAFAALTPDQQSQVLNDPQSRESAIDYSVVPEQVVPPQLTKPSSLPTLAGPSSTLSITVVSGMVTVNGTAHVVCSNIVTADSTIYLVDQVLIPTTPVALPSSTVDPASPTS